MYVCSVAIKYHIKTLNYTVMDAFNLGDNDIKQMMTLLHHRFLTIYSEAHGLSFATDPMFTNMRSKITAKFNENFCKLGKVRSTSRRRPHSSISRMATKISNDHISLGADNRDDAEEEPLDEDEDAAGGCIARLDNSSGINGIADEEVLDEVTSSIEVDSDCCII
ncbi:unnamed protein product [Sphagnum tenellum]